MYIVKRFYTDLVEVEIKIFNSEDVSKKAFIDCIEDEIYSSASGFSENEIKEFIKNAVQEKRFNGYDYGLQDVIISMSEIEEDSNKWFCVV